MFDSFKKILSDLQKKEDVEVYVEIPIEDFKEKEEVRRKNEDLGLKIPTRLESFLDLKNPQVLQEKQEKKEKDKKIVVLTGIQEEKQDFFYLPNTNLEENKNSQIETISNDHINLKIENKENKKDLLTLFINFLDNLFKVKKIQEREISETQEDNNQDAEKTIKFILEEKSNSLQEKVLDIKQTDKKSEKIEPKHLEFSKKEKENFGLQSDISFVFKSFAYFFGSLCFLSFAIYLFYFSNQTKILAKNLVQNNLQFDQNQKIKADNEIVISINPAISRNDVRSNILQFLFNQEIKFNEMLVLNPEYIQGENKNPIRSDEFLFIFFPNAPLTLRTVASTQNTIGTVNISSQNENFVSLFVDNSAVAYREFIFYEKDMYQDIKPIFNLREPIGKVSFKDASVNNHILRAMVDEEGVLFVYGFAGVRNIVFAPNVSVFEKVFERLK